MPKLLKNNRSRLILIAILFSAISHTSIGQELVYRIEYKEDSIGYLKATKTEYDHKVIYELESHTSFSLLLKFNHNALYKSEYENGMLTDALTQSFLNEKERSFTTISHKNGKYIINKDGETLHEISPIHESIAALYFNRPKTNQVFSERHGFFCRIKKINNQQFELIKPDDRKNVYFFEGDICSKATINVPMATVYLVKVGN